MGKKHSEQVRDMHNREWAHSYVCISFGLVSLLSLQNASLENANISHDTDDSYNDETYSKHDFQEDK